MTRIIFFGGSTGYGAWDEEGGWVDRLKRHTHKKVVAGELYCFLYNLGISGKSTNDMIMRMDFEIKQRIKSNEETVVLVEAGTNDSRYVHSKGSRETSPDEFAKNLKKIIEISRKYADKIFFIGPREIDQTKTDPIPWRTDLSFRLKDIEEYNNIMKRVCDEEGVGFVELFGKFKDPELLFGDGLHPSTKGHEIIFKTVLPVLEKNGII